MKDTFEIIIFIVFIIGTFAFQLIKNSMENKKRPAAAKPNDKRKRVSEFDLSEILEMNFDQPPQPPPPKKNKPPKPAPQTEMQHVEPQRTTVGEVDEVANPSDQTRSEDSAVNSTIANLQHILRDDPRQMVIMHEILSKPKGLQ